MSDLPGARLPESWKFGAGRPDVTQGAAFSGERCGNRFLVSRVSLAARPSRVGPGSGRARFGPTAPGMM